MHTQIDGAPAFAHIHVDLNPGESILAEADAMASMHADMDMTAEFNGGLFKGLARKYFGSESLFVNRFTNNTGDVRRVTLVQGTPGNIRQIELAERESYYLQPGAYIASTPNASLGVAWAGFGSYIGGEGLFRLRITGPGTVWYGAYGELLDKEIDGEYIVDTSHLVAYEPGMKLKVQFSGGLISSFTSGEGLVTRVEGKGKIVIQTRSLSGLAGWINPRL